ncbi:MAG: protein kinase [Candidatus Eisenbacteria bacterium]|nr:protein kinase [Candidatus Eisenbacteria bacterium]
MPLIPGSRLGPYEVLSPLGAGGMGEVFRARDSRLGRDVAIKVLPAAFAEEPERLARFEREARLLASLSHPNIAGIHGLEVVDGHRHLVLEFVDGVTLADRLKSGPLPIDEALAVGAQIAGALEAAHEAGIVHRDLKPGNVMLTGAGDVKVLDFGLARGSSTTANPGDQGLSASPTMTYAGTMAGVILGTAAYMSPEQARGRTLDRRTDIWSFGCVLYECLSGRSLFAGETVSDTIAKILEREPDWSALPARTPERVRELLRRCLEKDPKKRRRDAGEIRHELDEILAGGLSASGSAVPAAAAASRGGSRSARLSWAIAGLATLVALGALVVPRLQPAPAASPPIRATITLPHSARTLDNEACQLALSPDGSTLAYVAADSVDRTWLWIRPLGSLESRALARIESGVGQPFWSPDSRRVGFFADGKLKIVGLDGSSPQVICDAPDGRGGTWNREGTILFTPTSTGPIHRVSAAGGTSEPAMELDAAAGETTQRFPRFLADGRHFTFSSLPVRDNGTPTFVTGLGSHERHLLGMATSGMVLATPDNMVFNRGTNLMAQRCDPSSWKPIGEAVVIGLAEKRVPTAGGPAVTAGPGGILVYPTTTKEERFLVWISREDGRMTRLAVPPAPWVGVSLSPDERQAVAVRIDDDGMSRMWMIDTIRGSAVPFGGEPGAFGPVLWSPDGQEVYYGRRREGRQDILARKTAGGEARLVFQNDTFFTTPSALTPDGRYLLFRELDPGTLQDLSWVSPSGGEPTRVITGPGNEGGGTFSPDGRWVLYTSDEGGRSELYVAAFPSGEGRVQITSGGGASPRWIHGTWEILYLDSVGRVMSIAVVPGPLLRFGEPSELTHLRRLGNALYSTSHDGRRFLTSWGEGDDQEPTLTLLANWQGMVGR